MVLSSPAATDAVPSRRWLDRLNAVFHLARERGVMVLVRGGPERFGDVVRRVLELAPDAEVLVRADAMASLEPGSTVVVYLRRQDFGWLNMARPVVRGHRVVLFGDPETTLALEQEAFDFFDWISHRIEAPEGPPAFAVRALRSAACARANVVVWKGGDLDGTFAEALPGRKLMRVSAARTYGDLVEAMRPKPRTWVVVTDLGEGFRVQRARWAAAEAGRYGRTILVESGWEVEGVPAAHGKPASIEEATAKLSAVGVVRAARIAALLNLEPEAIESAAMLARAGAAEATIEAAATDLTNPAAGPRDLSMRRLPGWAERVLLALRPGDEEVALRWAMSWRAAQPKSAEALATLALVRFGQGGAEGAPRLLKEAKRLAGATPDAPTRIALCKLEGVVRAAAGELEEASRAFEEGRKLLRQTKGSPDDIDELWLVRFQTLQLAGRDRDAERVLREWLGPEMSAGDSAPRIVALAAWKLHQGKSDETLRLLRPLLDRTESRDAAKRDAIIQMMTQALLHQRGYDEAERWARTAVEEAERHGRRSRHLRHEHARALAALGRFAEAEQEFRRLLPGVVRPLDRAHTLSELARVLGSQGRMTEAEPLLGEAITELRGHASDSSLLAELLFEKAMLRNTAGDERSAIVLLREAVKREERTWGRDHPGLVIPLTGLAGCLTTEGAPAEAEPLLRRALRLAERANDRLAIANALGMLALAQEMRRLPQATDTARRAVEAWRATNQEPPPELRATLDEILARNRSGSVSAPPSKISRTPRHR